LKRATSLAERRSRPPFRARRDSSSELALRAVCGRRPKARFRMQIGVAPL
jgi:hypothetical protein